MRRKDREMPEAFGLAVIDKAPFATLCISDEGGLPYAVPLSVARKGEYLYFHSARSGRKAELLVDKKFATLVFVADVRVPQLYSDEQLQRLAQKPEQFSQRASDIFTTEFASAIASGRIEKLTSLEDKVLGLAAVCEKYTPEKMQYVELALRDALPITAVYRMHIDTLTAKRKKYDDQGEELKHGRME